MAFETLRLAQLSAKDKVTSVGGKNVFSCYPWRGKKFEPFLREWGMGK